MVNSFNQINKSKDKWVSIKDKSMQVSYLTWTIIGHIVLKSGPNSKFLRHISPKTGGLSC